MLVKCDVPHSPKTVEEELTLVAELALKGEDFETPNWRGGWLMPRCFSVSFKGHSSYVINSALLWLSDWKTWYQPRNGVAGPNWHLYIPTHDWDPRPVAVDWQDLEILYREGPDGLARVKLGMNAKLAELADRWRR